MSDIVGKCYKRISPNGVETYYRIVHHIGSAMYRADVVRMSHRGVDIEIDAHYMDWQFKGIEEISQQEYVKNVLSIENLLGILGAGERRYGE